MPRQSHLFSALFLLPFAAFGLSYLMGHAVPDPLGNRPLAKLPEQKLGFPTSAYLQGTASWAVEHSPFRYRAIQWRNTALLGAAKKLYPVPVNPGHADICYGKDGWLFLLNEGPPQRSKESVRAAIKQAEKIARNVRDSGRRFYFVICPDKASVYPEQLGWTKRWAERRAPRTMLHETITQAWKKAPEVQGSYLPLWDAMLEAKNRGESLYWRWDTHWNFVGMLAAARALVNGMQPGLFEEDAVVLDGKFHRGVQIGFDLSSQFLLQDSEDDTPNYVIRRQGAAPKIETFGFADPLYAGVTYYHCSSSLPKVVKGRTVIVCDSFMMAQVTLLAPWFEDLTVIHHGALGTLELAEALKKSQTIVWSSVERAWEERVDLWTGTYRFFLRGALAPSTPGEK